MGMFDPYDLDPDEDVLLEQEDIIDREYHSLNTKLNDLINGLKNERNMYTEYPILLPPDYIEEVKLNVDYWTRGKISELYSDVEARFTSCIDEQGEILYAKLRKMIIDIKKARKKKEEALDLACREAGMHFAQSRERRNAGRLIQNRLTKNHGWRLNKGVQQGFLDKDPRNAVRLEFVNPAGDVITIDIMTREQETIPVVSVRYATLKTIGRDYQNVLQRNLETILHKYDIIPDSIIFI